MSSVLIITGPMGGHGGEESVLKTLISDWGNTNKINLLVSDLSGDKDWINDISDRLTNVTVFKHGSSRLLKMLKVLAAVNRDRSELVIAMSPRMLWIASIAQRLKHKHAKLMSWLHFSPDEKYSSSTLKLLKKADGNLVLTHAMAKQLQLFGIDDHKLFVVGNPVKRTIRTIASTDNGSVANIICVARIQFDGQKNLQELFNACSLLKGKWQLHLYGSDDSNDHLETRKCQDLIARLGIQDHVVWHGFSPNFWNEINKADCLVLTSRLEGFPMALCEAISYGIPVISSDCPTGPAEIVNEQNGFLYQMGDTAQLAILLQDFINKVYDFDRDLVKDSISDKYVDNYLKHFNEILSTVQGKG